MNDVYAGLAPAELWKHFDALNGIPRPSGKEAAARAYVQDVAGKAGCKWRTDAAGNCVVYVPSRVPGGTKTVAVQSHLDMVKATAPGVVHDFDKDPIVPRRDGDRIVATGTTLGADNGIGAAACLALISDSTLATGPLEVLFTVEEETGLVGATALDGSMLSAKSLVNLDSEDPETVTIGCAGGETMAITLPCKRSPIPDGWHTREISVSGLRGGHSGVDIHEQRANAIKLLSSVLTATVGRVDDFRLIRVTGGSAHNAIPRDASAVVALPPTSKFLHGDRLSAEHAAEAAGEPNFRIEVAPVRSAVSPLEEGPGEVANALIPSDGDRLIALLGAIPTGVLAMSEVFENQVQTSDNLATVVTDEDSIEIVVSIRSFIAHEIQDLHRRIADTATSAGATTRLLSSYPSWQPNPHSELLKVTTDVFREINGHDPIVEVVHAGLECGVISSKVPGMEAVSFGPSIAEAHSPHECIYPESVASTWTLLLGVLKRLSETAA